MLRPLFTLLAAFSLPLFLAACALWIRGHFVQDTLTWHRTHTAGAIRSVPNHIIIDYLISPSPQLPAPWHRSTADPDPDALATAKISGFALNVDAQDTWTQWDKAGFAYWGLKSPRGTTIAMLAIPDWSIATLAALLPAAFLAIRLRSARRSARRRHSGHCPTCGYDLRATPDRCPECGAGRPGGENGMPKTPRPNESRSRP